MIGRCRGRHAIADRLPLDEYRYLHATRAELLTRPGRTDGAIAALRRAVELAPREGADRRLLARRLAALVAGRAGTSA